MIDIAELDKVIKTYTKLSLCRLIFQLKIVISSSIFLFKLLSLQLYFCRASLYCLYYFLNLLLASRPEVRGILHHGVVQMLHDTRGPAFSVSVMGMRGLGYFLYWRTLSITLFFFFVTADNDPQIKLIFHTTFSSFPRIPKL